MPLDVFTPFGMSIYKATETADFIQLVNEWFDVLNSSLSTFALSGKEPFVISLENQQDKLLQMNNVMCTPIIPNKKRLEFFQKGVIITNNALIMLQKYIKAFNMTYIITRRLNQDVLEHFFGAIRSNGGLGDHPSPQEFKYRLRKYILARNTEHLSGSGNVENDTTEWLEYDTCATNNNQHNEVIEDRAADDSELLCLSVTNNDEFTDLNESDLNDIGILQEDALEYISGYMIRKLQLKEYECHENSYTWVVSFQD